MPEAPAVRAVVFDLDGVIRHFDPAATADIERRHRLDPGTLAAHAFADPWLGQVTTGRISRAAWIDAIATRIGDAAFEWGRLIPAVDPAVLELVDELRALGLVTAILTNGTDTIAAELAGLGIADRFDHVFNSAGIGYAKPDVRAFAHVVSATGIEAAATFFTDDSMGKLAGADAFGMTTHHFQGADGLRDVLRTHGIAV